MERILVVLDDLLDVESVAQRCAAEEVARACEIAVCIVLPVGEDALVDGLRAQKRVTAALRKALGERAEKVPVFVATKRPGYGVEDCARSWGATGVRA